MRARNDGFVLVSVLWVVALLTVITLSYHHRARLEVQAARYSLDARQATLAARAAVERGILELRNKAVVDAMAAPASGGAGLAMTHLGQPWAREHDLYEEDALLPRKEGFDEDAVTFTITDLDRYIDLNHAPMPIVEGLPGISRSVARRIRFQRSGSDGAGSPGVFRDVAELRFVDGIDEDDWFGDASSPGLRSMLTTFGDGRVNLNTAPVEVLRHLPRLGDGVADDILAIRNGEDGLPATADDRGFSDWESFSSATQITGDALIALKQLCKFDSDYFKITGVATRRGGRIRAACAAVVRLPAGSNVATLISWTEESLGSQ